MGLILSLAKSSSYHWHVPVISASDLFFWLTQMFPQFSMDENIQIEFDHRDSLVPNQDRKVQVTVLSAFGGAAVGSTGGGVRGLSLPRPGGCGSPKKMVEKLVRSITRCDKDEKGSNFVYLCGDRNSKGCQSFPGGIPC